MTLTEKNLALALARNDLGHIDKQMRQLNAEIAELEKRRRQLEAERIKADWRVCELESDE